MAAARLALRLIAVLSMLALLPILDTPRSSSLPGGQVAQKAPRTGPALPAGAGDAWLAGIERSLAAREYEVTRNVRGLQAPNRAQDLRTYFEADGIRVVDRTGHDPAELLELRLEAWGRSGRLTAAAPGELSSAGPRAEIHRPGLVEWYENSSAGLEQGFTLGTKPAGEGDLVLDLCVGGARASAQGEGLVLTCAEGRRLEYGALAAYDAAGKRLPARIETSGPDRIRIAVTDVAAAYPVTIDPLLRESGMLQSNQAQSYFGFNVAGAGDVNGDGYADVIVAAEAYDAGEPDEGAAFVFHGGPSGIPNGSPASAAGILQSNLSEAAMGSSVAGAGDVNGDGYDDVIVGSDYYSEGGEPVGAAFLFLGSASGIASGDPSTAATRLVGDQGFSNFGGCVAGVGDVNGDGYDDVAVGALAYSLGEDMEGAAFVWQGSPWGIPSGGPGSAHATFQSNQAYSQFGIAVAPAGDVNADGLADVLVGACAYDAGQVDEGAAFIFHGERDAIPSGDPTTANTMLQSDQANALLGYSVAGAGDVNGDGYSDVIIGAIQYSSGSQANEGAAFVFLGRMWGVASGNLASASATLQSNQVQAYFGNGLAGAGDINGDGYADVVVGASYYDAGQTDEGAAFVYLGGPAGIASGGPEAAAIMLQCDQEGAALGKGVAGVGDVNGDGFADLVVGAYRYDRGEVNEGAVFLYLGGANVIAGGTPASACGLLEANQAVADLGVSVAGAGDVNGDGYADVIVGAHLYDSGETDEGAAFVFLGGASGITGGNPGTAAAVLQSNQAGASFGLCVAGAGDVNGDGYSDVIVGAPNYGLGESFEGAAFIFRGSASGVASGNPATASAILQSNQAMAMLGVSVAGAGDVNGDGYADVIVAAPYYSSGEAQEGATFVFHGSAAGVASGSPATAAATLQSNQAGAQLGCSVAGAGDVNGDGYADVIVGAHKYSAGEPEEGAAFVFLGSATGIGNRNPVTAATVLQANQAGAHLGQGVAGAGDVNGDGFGDVIVGAPDYAPGAKPMGATFIFAGSASGVASGSPATASTTLVPLIGASSFGGSVAGAGDVNGDGYADVIVGAYGYDVSALGQGAAFLYLGSATGVASATTGDAAAMLQPLQSGAHFGRSVAGAGDVNGDGFADLIVGAPDYSFGESSEGVAFVFLGGGGGGRPVLARQSRGYAIGTPVQAWGGSGMDGGVWLRLRGIDPSGRGRVKLEAECCPPGVPFGSPSCSHAISAVWEDVGRTSQGVTLDHQFTGLASGTLYRWRVRVLRASYTGAGPWSTPPPHPAHGPWWRLSGQVVEGDIRTAAHLVAADPPTLPGGLAIGSIRPNPAEGGFAVSFVLPSAGRARLEIFTVAGRRVHARDLTVAQAGPQTVTLGEDLRLPAGIYLVRVSQAGRADAKRVAVLP